MFVRGRYGHGGRLGYEREWRADPAISGGGELHRPGRPPDRPRRAGSSATSPTSTASRATYFWDMPVDDNAFLLLRTAADRSRGCTSAAPSGRTCSRSRSTAATASCRSTASAAATASSGCVLPDAAGDGPARDDDLGVSRRRSVVGARVRGVPRRYPPRPRAVRRTAPTRARRSPSSNESTRDPAMISSGATPSMIITRSPLRITLGGGGTDLPSYYREHGGFLIAAAIDKYVYVTVMRPFAPGSILKYSKLEHVDAVDEVQHPIIREAFALLELQDAAGRNHDAGRHPGRHRPRLVGQLHDGAAQGAVRASPTPAAPERARRAGVRHRDRPARRADRQAGSVHRRLRRRSPASRSIRTARSRPSR